MQPDPFMSKNDRGFWRGEKYAGGNQKIKRRSERQYARTKDDIKDPFNPYSMSPSSQLM